MHYIASSRTVSHMDVLFCIAMQFTVITRMLLQNHVFITLKVSIAREETFMNFSCYLLLILAIYAFDGKLFGQNEITYHFSITSHILHRSGLYCSLHSGDLLFRALALDIMPLRII